MKKTITVIFIIQALACWLYAQGASNKETMENDIKNILYNETGRLYMINLIDINERMIKENIIIDNKNLLKDCYLFSARDTSFFSKMLLGVYKNGNIIWKTGPIINAISINFLGDLWRVADLKHDGNVYVIFSVTYLPRGYFEGLWIIRWNGISGEIVNQYDDDGISTINAIQSSFQLIDLEGDGIIEVLGNEILPSNSDNDKESEVQTKEVVFSWQNGILGDFGATKPSFLPKDKVNVKVGAKVKESNKSLSYSYKLINEETSLQSIGNFSIGSKVDTIISKKLPLKWEIFNRDDLSIIYFTIDPFYHIDNEIYPGYADSSFEIVTKYPPTIVRYFVQGINGDVDKLEVIPTNSKTGFTIGPLEIEEPIENIKFLDSLIDYANHSFNLNWIHNQQTADKYTGYLTNTKTALQQNNISLARTNLQNILHDVDIDSSGAITSEAFALLSYNTEYLLSQLPQPPNGLQVKLANSNGINLPGGSLQYYESGWKDATDNGDGTFTVDTQLKTVSLRMTYEYGSQTKNNVTVGTDTVVFQTVNTMVKLQDSRGNAIDTGIVQYYAGGWRNFGSTVNGTVSKELLTANYTFRMSYGYASNDKTQNLDTNTTVVFQTINTSVQLQDSQGNLIDQGTVQYYSGGWREFGSTSNGVVTKELLPNNYTFRMTYGFISNDKTQNTAVNNTVTFSTVHCLVTVKDAQNQPVNSASVSYYSGGWRQLGTTVNGEVVKELLPANLTFRINYEGVQRDKTQNLSTNSTVNFVLGQ